MPDRPDPPDVPQYLVDGLNRQPPEHLQAVAAYADSLAAWKTGDDEGESEDQETQTPSVEQQKSPPEDVPSRATIVTKQINGNHYHYWQWRDGENIKSKYEGPVADTE